jgi:hypothetical protein
MDSQSLVAKLGVVIRRLSCSEASIWASAPPSAVLGIPAEQYSSLPTLARHVPGIRLRRSLMVSEVTCELELPSRRN